MKLARGEGGVLELETMSEGEVESARAEGAEAFFELGRGLRLLVRDLAAHFVFDPLQSFVRDGVPAAIVDRARGKEPDLDRRRRRRRRRARRLVTSAGDEGHSRQHQHCVFHMSGLYSLAANRDRGAKMLSSRA